MTEEFLNENVFEEKAKDFENEKSDDFEDENSDKNSENENENETEKTAVFIPQFKIKTNLQKSKETQFIDFKELFLKHCKKYDPNYKSPKKIITEKLIKKDNRKEFNYDYDDEFIDDEEMFIEGFCGLF